MNIIFQDPSARLRCLSALTGIFLMAAVLLGEGQARTIAPTPDNHSIQVSMVNNSVKSSLSKNTMTTGGQHFNPKQQPTNATPQKERSDKNPEKKRMGLAILFLGILAEEG